MVAGSPDRGVSTGKGWYTQNALVDLRIYRASMVVALLALVVVMFSLQERPRPLAAPIAPDAFRGTGAWSEGQRLSERLPDRRPGSAGDQRLGDMVQARFRAMGMETSRDRFTAEWDGADTEMSNVFGVLRAQSDRQILVLAHRDAAGRPGASSAVGTATLLELASALDGSSRKKTFVLVSTDGAVADAAGARRLAESYPDRDKVDAVLVLDDLGGTPASRPFLIPWSTDSSRGSLQALRTADAALRRETGVAAGSESWLGQFLRQAWPLTLREQGPLVREGLNAITMTATGELPVEPADDTLGRISQERLNSFGRAAFATALAFDSAPRIESSPRRYITAGRHLVPGWAFGLLAVGLAVPALITAFDAFARGMRRRVDMTGWARWVLAGAVPFAVTLAVAYLLELVGVLPATISEALAPSTAPGFGEVAARWRSWPPCWSCPGSICARSPSARGATWDTAYSRGRVTGAADRRRDPARLPLEPLHRAAAGPGRASVPARDPAAQPQALAADRGDGGRGAGSARARSPVLRRAARPGAGRVGLRADAADGGDRLPARRGARLCRGRQPGLGRGRGAHAVPSPTSMRRSRCGGR